MRVHIIITTAVSAATLLISTQAMADATEQIEKFKVCARDAAIAELKRAQQSGEIPAGAGDMFVAIEPYVDKAYAACAALRPPGTLLADGRPSAEIQDFVNTAAFDFMYDTATHGGAR